MARTARQATLSLPLRGAGGEPIDFARTVRSHGLVALPPFFRSPELDALEVAVRLRDGTARTLVLREDPPGTLAIAAQGALGAAARADVIAAVGAMFALDDDLSAFYARAGDDPALRWAAQGAGRLLRGQTAFEDVVKTICTTNCTWSSTERMIDALVARLGTRAPGAPVAGPRGRAFPAPAALAEAPEAFYRDVARAGYRGAYLRSLGAAAAAGTIDLEGWRAAPRSALPDAELERLLLALPGVGPYAAAHVMMLFGRRSRLVFDSWTRPKYARLNGRKAKDATIVRRFKRYGDEAGLAFWLYLTHDWLE